MRGDKLAKEGTLVGRRKKGFNVASRLYKGHS